MRSRLGVLLVLPLAVLLLATASHSRETKSGQVRFQQALSEGEFLSDIAEIDPGLLARYTSAAVDTYCIVWYDFEPNTWQGWTRFDNTNDDYGVWFHADDFDGLDGGYAGRLVPIEGTKSIWCGARPDDLPYEYLCTWQNAPGYGNGWDQILVTSDFSFTGMLNLSYHGVFDSEPGWDYTRVEYDAGDGDWQRVFWWGWCGIVDTVVTHDLRLTQTATKLRFHFVSDGFWSDKDGYFQSDGACIIDEITIADDSGVIDYEDFEEWDVGATSDPGSMWRAELNDDLIFGTYSGLITNLLDKDPCGDNFGTQIVFFINSPYPSEDYPGLFVTPFCENFDGTYYHNPCQDESVISPVIDLTKYSTGHNSIQDSDIPAEDLGNLGGALLRFTTYRDLYEWNLVWYTWSIRNVDPVTGCPGPWRSSAVWYSYGNEKAYVYQCHDIGKHIYSDQIQVCLRVLDLADGWACCFEIEGHTPAPWFDNVRVYRYSKLGPQWSYRSLDLFQDNFPEDEFDLESYVRADATNDINSNDNPVIRPGDSVVVECGSPLAGGLREGGVTGDEEVYCHVRVTDIGPFGKPALLGLQLVGTYGTYVSDDGEWTVMQCPTALSGGVYPVEGKYMIDLNDALFTRGYMIEYYFEAYDLDNERTTLPEHADESQYFEFTCLPTGKSDLLYVDDFHGRGCHEGVVELYFNQVFEAVIPPENQPDRYDVNSPSSLVSNGLGGRAKLNHILWDHVQNKGYAGIIWDSGNLDIGTISDGSTLSDKSNDAQLLADWLDQADYCPGLWISGDGIASELYGSPTPQAGELLSIWGGVQLNNESYFQLTGGRYSGGVVNPLVTGTPEGIFGTSLQFNVFGGCPTINDFDVLEPTGNGIAALAYPDYGGSPCYAAIQSETTNSMGQNARVLWFGFSFMYIRDIEAQAPIVRNVLFDWGKSWLGFGISNDNITEDDTPKAYRLSQNFPNPFNPATKIKFDIKKKGRVRLRIYNVAGQLVKTIVDEVLDAGSYTREWKGTNNSGSEVASGVYFYRLEAGEYENVKKMVLLR